MPVHLPPDRVPGRPQLPLATAPPRPAQPVFVDVTGTRRRRIQRAGVLVAAASLSYLPLAASALLPGPSTPAQPGPLSAGGAPREAGDRPTPAPSPLDGPARQEVPDPEDPVVPVREPAVPEPKATTQPRKTVTPTIRPLAPAPSPSPKVPPGDWSPPVLPPRPVPPAEVPEIPTPPPTASPTVTPPATADPTPGAAG
ncbi:hypothetical protein ACFOW4_14990 [Micromonospora sp. GCM10011542]|uniref:hypothetical protein n=1 Tax=Micromonospora sp. GCM10011542 TaxID=3317337 RepID=UPI00361C014A